MSTHPVAIRWISVDTAKPTKGANVLYWNPKGYVEIADEWNDEHHLPFASHWAEIVEPIELQDARNEARDKVMHDLDLQGKMLEVAKAALTAARKNEERYFWLRDKSKPGGVCPFYLSVVEAFKDTRFKPETVDAQIDAALAAGMEWETNDG